MNGPGSKREMLPRALRDTGEAVGRREGSGFEGLMVRLDFVGVSGAPGVLVPLFRGTREV